MPIFLLLLLLEVENSSEETNRHPKTILEEDIFGNTNKGKIKQFMCGKILYIATDNITTCFNSYLVNVMACHL